jgi:hypothetical protein
MVEKAADSLAGTIILLAQIQQQGAVPVHPPVVDQIALSKKQLMIEHNQTM